MRTREQSLNNFCALLGDLINSNYLFAGGKLLSVMNAVKSSKLLSDIFEYFCEGFDYEQELSKAFSVLEDQTGFLIPEKNTDAIALIYLLLREIAYKRVQFTVILDCFCQDSDYDEGYRNFATAVLEPFKQYVFELGMQIIKNTQPEEQIVEISNPTIEEVSFQEDKPSEKANYLTLLRLLDLDKLAVTQSKNSKDVVEELNYVIDILSSKIREGDSEKIKLSYLAYYYALLPYKKIKSNVSEVTKILIENKIL